ncbi:MAG TPA: DUF3999 domain-containing protein [Dokdonella sp.]|jgi:hypothetical protein|nr:DUF3999 domain-containing protein [Dokdonella sp.]
MKILLAFGCLAMQMAAAATPADYARVIPIDTAGDSAAWQVELDDQVYAGSIDPNLRDLAIFNADGQAVPLILSASEAPDAVIEQRAAVPVLPLPPAGREREQADLHLLVERDASGRLRRLETQSSDEPGETTATREWLLDLGEFDRGIDRLELAWSEPQGDIIARFEVTGSNDLQRWDLLNADATLVVLEQGGARVDRREIALPVTRFRYLRLRRHDDGAPLGGISAQASRVRRVAGVTPVNWIEAEAVDSVDGHPASGTQHLYTLRYSVPASQVRITLGSDNALAQLEVLTPFNVVDGKTHWIQRARPVAFRLVQDGDVIDNGAIALSPGARVRDLRIDSATALATTPRLSVGYRPARLVFLAEGKGPFLLAVGSATARFPDYPVEAALATLRARLGRDWQPPVATLGDSRSSAGASALQAPKVPLDWKRWLLWAVLIGAAAVVGGIALSLLRGTGQGRAEDRQQPPEE